MRHPSRLKTGAGDRAKAAALINFKMNGWMVLFAAEP